ncbi:Zinc finger CCCH domain-containing protein 7B Rotavirus 'X'-associated non-structural protein [Channa argus]|uniref:Zinc finger CCCH domain-containing protein 7B Rotavirus 'X'-associated non-structural protein n=1 Tax=Channa argus TaxID=215402 RepID=A0A6G1QE05_CHAAH|nr:Zinc finger CCCH domain-containing protein 7B Rotavirus 'X'-associated non-structural protein [Channa argus]
MDPARRKRKEDIKKALIFIQSSLAYPEPEDYQDFLIRLVCNLLEEGNDLFRDQEWDRAVREYSEGLNVSSYAAGEEIHIPEVLLESLYVNRAAAYHSMGEYERGVKDCDRALEMCKESRRALYRKGLCLKELGKYKEAYNCTTDCLLISRLDKQVNELAQELAVHLGLKIRKPYVAAKDDTLIRKDVAKGNMTAEATKVSGVHVGNGLNPLSSLAPVTFPETTQSIVTSTLSSCSQPTVTVADREDTLDDLELMGDDLDSLLDCFPTEQKPAEIQTQAAFSVSSRMSPPTVPSVLPAPTPQLPPAFFSSSVSQFNSLDSFSSARHSTTTLDTLDNLLSQQRLDDLDNFSGSGGNAGTPNSRLTPVVMDALDGLDTLDDLLDSAVNAASSEKVNESKTESDTREKSLDLLDELDPLENLSDSDGHITDGLKLGVKVMDRLDSLDTLDSFLSVETVGAASTAAFAGGTDLKSLSRFRADGISGSHIAAAPVIRSAKKERNNQALAVASNPLSSTHEFLQACSACFPREGRGIYTYVHKPDLVHNCKRDILLCRQKADDPSDWTRVRQLPATTSFKGPFVLCKELIKSGDLGLCKFGEKCTFAYNQLEIDVWTEERKGTLNRNLLFKTDPASCIIGLLQEHKGTFMFLCQECFNSKPRIFSKRCRENLTICSNLDARHTFDANKCLAFQVRAHNVIYNKVRPLGVMCHLDFCRKYIGYSYCREENCAFAHSCIELKTWTVQQHTGISHDEIVEISTKYYEKLDQNFSKQKGNKQLSYEGGGGKPKEGGGVGGAGKSLNMKMKFACAHCWRDGNIVEPDKTLKYCTAKASHPWTKDRRVLLVRSIERSKWIQVRPLPQSKFPVEFEVCTQMLRRRKCDYSGNCTFAHSQEEKDMWMYMKNNDLRDMQQIYNMWLTLSTQSPQTDGAAVTQPVAEDKYIVMPTDYAEPMSDFYCRLCGKNSNSERQWQQHISTEKHKDRVFSYEEEEEALMWSCRFPGRCFEICPKLDGGCADGVSCDYAHSPKELQEWTERRDFLRQKLARAREDMLVMPDEVDFGKYNFLLQD